MADGNYGHCEDCGKPLTEEDAQEEFNRRADLILEALEGADEELREALLSMFLGMHLSWVEPEYRKKARRYIIRLIDDETKDWVIRGCDAQVVKSYVPYEGPIISRAEARALGLTRFFPGSRCRRAGHLSQRMVSNGACATCLLIHSDARQKANPEKQRAAIAASKAKNIEKVRAGARAYSKAHQARHAEYRRNRNAAKRAAKLAARMPEPSDYIGPTVTRAYAKANGLTRFFTGKPCKHNHLSQRTTANGGCIKCNALTLTSYLEAEGTPQYAKRKALQRVVKHRRRARERNAEGKFTAADILCIGERQKWKCRWCGKPTKKNYHADHLIPLANGGTNWPSNIVISCQPCNSAKSSMDPLEFAQRNGRLL